MRFDHCEAGAASRNRAMFGGYRVQPVVDRQLADIGPVKVHQGLW